MRLLLAIMICSIAASKISATPGTEGLRLSHMDFISGKVIDIDDANWQFTADGYQPTEQPDITDAFHAFWLKDQAQNLPSDRGYLSLHIELDQVTKLALKIPDYPFYRLYLDGELIFQHGDLNEQGEIIAKRSYQIIELGYVQQFHLQFYTVFDGSVWMRLEGLKLASPEILHHDLKRLLVMQNLIIGILLVTAIYQLSLFFLVPDRKAPLYCGLFLLVLILRSATTGQAQPVHILLPDFDWEWSWKLGFIGFYASIPLILSFMQAIFPGTLSTATVRMFWLPALAFTTIALFTTVSFYGSINGWYQMVTLLALGLSLRSFYLAFRRRLIGSRIMLGAIIALLVTTLNDILLIAGYIRTYPLLEFGLVIFVISQTIIVSMKFSHAYHKIEHTNRELRKIVYDHVIARISAGDSIERTMPTGFQHAAVLCFDMVKSSKIQHPNFPEALERVMARCTLHLNENYDAKYLKANGYRIKEMGDGLLASIGFPFVSPGDQNSCELALKLALRFCEIFREEMGQLQYSEPLFCSVGIAFGKIEGFFPKQGIRQYDVRGRALILATRYESMRNLVFDKFGRQGSVIFIQDRVYQNLSPTLQKSFQFWNCREPQSRIRDDQKATQAWFMFVPPAGEVSKLHSGDLQKPA